MNKNDVPTGDSISGEIVKLALIRKLCKQQKKKYDISEIEEFDDFLDLFSNDKHRTIVYLDDLDLSSVAICNFVNQLHRRKRNIRILATSTICPHPTKFPSVSNNYPPPLTSRMRIYIHVTSGLYHKLYIYIYI